MTRGSTASFASRMTSPVDGSTTSVAAKAPSSSASATSTDSTPALRSAAIAFEVIFLPACGDDVSASLQVLRRAQPDEAVVDRPVDRAVAELQPVDGVEVPDDLVGAAQAEGAQEDGGEELPLAIDPDVQEVLGVVLELDPRAAVRDDLRDVERLVFGVEERARRAVELRHDDALGAVDDERAVVRHQRDVAVIDFLLLDVADGLDAGLRVLVPDHEPDRDLERHGVGHAAFLAFVDVVLQLQADGVAADVTDVAARLVRLAAARAEDVVLAVRIGNQRVAAVDARLAEVVQARRAGRTCTPSCRSSTR